MIIHCDQRKITETNGHQHMVGGMNPTVKIHCDQKYEEISIKKYNLESLYRSPGKNTTTRAREKIICGLEALTYQKSDKNNEDNTKSYRLSRSCNAHLTYQQKTFELT